MQQIIFPDPDLLQTPKRIELTQRIVRIIFGFQDSGIFVLVRIQEVLLSDLLVTRRPENKGEMLFRPYNYPIRTLLGLHGKPTLTSNHTFKDA